MVKHPNLNFRKKKTKISQSILTKIVSQTIVQLNGYLTAQKKTVINVIL